MSHRLRKAMNAFHEESALRNCLPEIKDVSKSEGSCIKERTEAANAICKWGKDQDEGISTFLNKMAEFEEEYNAAAVAYLDGYGHFYSVWKDILKDRSELRECIHAHRKVGGKVVKLQEKIDAAKKKGEKGADALVKLNAEIEEAKVEEKQLSEKAQQKVIEVQQEMHDLLRNGYYKLHDSRMKMFKHVAVVSERALSVISNFQNVKPSGSAENTDFEFVPFAEPVGTEQGRNPVWHKGEEFQQKLEEQLATARKGMDAQMRQLSDSLSAEVAELKARLQQQQQQHDAALAAMRSEGQAQLQRELMQVVLALGSQNIDDAEEGVEKDIIDFLAVKSREAHGACMSLEESPVQNVAILSRTVFGTVFSAVGAVHTLDSEQGEVLFAMAKKAGGCARTLFDLMNERVNRDPNSNLANQAETKPLADALEKIIDFATKAAIHTEIPANVSKNISAAQAAIRETLQTIAALKTESEKTDKERALEVNQGLLAAGQTMFQAAKEVIDSATDLQDKLGGDNGEKVAESEHKLRVRKWVAALGVAVNAIVENSPMWLECLRQVVKGKGKHEEMQVASRGISASTAQLVAFVRSTLSRETNDSPNQPSVIEKATEQLQTSSHVVIAFIRDAHQLLLANVAMDQYSELSENQARRLIMNTQVEVLRLESSLTREREKLASLRRLNYSDEVERRNSPQKQ